MPSNVLNRKAVREDLATKIDAKFGAEWDVYSYKVKALGGKARNIAVSSRGSGREIRGAKATETDSTFRFSIFVFVLYASDEQQWTEQESEDAMDGAEKDLTDLFNDNQSGAYWNRLTIEGVSDADMVQDVGGQVFRREIITVRTEKYT